MCGIIPGEHGQAFARKFLLRKCFLVPEIPKILLFNMLQGNSLHSPVGLASVGILFVILLIGILFSFLVMMSEVFMGKCYSRYEQISQKLLRTRQTLRRISIQIIKWNKGEGKICSFVWERAYAHSSSLVRQFSEIYHTKNKN